MKKTFGLMILLCILSGCASIRHMPINSSVDEDNLGIRYYQSSPYLIVYSNGKGGIVTKIEYLPDPNKKMSAVPKSFMATIKTTMEFKNGVLTSNEEEGDGTVVPKAILKAVETAAPAFLAALNKTDVRELTVPAPYIYKIVVDGNDIIFVGKKGDTNIKITLLPQKKDN